MAGISHHCLICSTSVIAFHTVSMGASKVRSMSNEVPSQGSLTQTIQRLVAAFDGVISPDHFQVSASAETKTIRKVSLV